MRVVSYKKINNFRITQKCRRCGAKLQVEEDDVKFKPNPMFMPLDDYGCFYVNCPICGEEIHLNLNQVAKYKRYMYTNGEVAKEVEDKSN